MGTSVESDLVLSLLRLKNGSLHQKASHRKKRGDLCVSDPPCFQQRGCSTHEQPTTLFCSEMNTAVASGTVLCRGNTSLTRGFSRRVRNGRHRTPARIGVLLFRTAKGYAWPSTHPPNRAGRCRCAGAEKPVSSLQAGNCAVSLQPVSHKRWPSKDPCDVVGRGTDVTA